VGILDDYQAAVLNVRQSVVHSSNLLLVCVTAIVEHNVDWPDGLKKFLPKVGIRLATNIDFKTMLTPLYCVWVVFHAYDTGSLAKIVSPHKERAPAKYPDFNEDNGATTVLL
jgi:hypothetical protein